jgi:hypothetical protein
LLSVVFRSIYVITFHALFFFTKHVCTCHCNTCGKQWKQGISTDLFWIGPEARENPLPQSVKHDPIAEQFKSYNPSQWTATSWIVTFNIGMMDIYCSLWLFSHLLGPAPGFIYTLFIQRGVCTFSYILKISASPLTKLKIGVPAGVQTPFPFIITEMNITTYHR